MACMKIESMVIIQIANSILLTIWAGVRLCRWLCGLGWLFSSMFACFL